MDMDTLVHNDKGIMANKSCLLLESSFQIDVTYRQQDSEKMKVT